MHIRTRVIPIRHLWVRWAAAAAVILFLAGEYWYFQHQRSTLRQAQAPVASQDVKAPETNRATITLANGRKIYLDSAADGELATESNVNLVKTSDGTIIYTSQKGAGGEQLQYNTLYNPRGSKVITLTLSDGSRIWLNAESSITYPIAFTGNKRNVQITGEAYFEVAHNPAMPFSVSKKDVTVEVLGTHFNVNAYEDEDEIRVTLLEGSVEVKRETSNVKVRPGEQAVTGGNGQLVINKDVDLDAVMAWKNGLFHFENSTIREVMRQIARWYDVDVSYEGKIPDMKFGGEITRNTNVSQVLKILEESNVHFKIEGKKIIVTP